MHLSHTPFCNHQSYVLDYTRSNPIADPADISHAFMYADSSDVSSVPTVARQPTGSIGSTFFPLDGEDAAQENHEDNEVWSTAFLFLTSLLKRTIYQLITENWYSVMCCLILEQTCQLVPQC